VNAGFADQLTAAFAAHADTERARDMRAYMKGKFEFFGLAAPLRRSLQRMVPRPLPPDLVQNVLRLWEAPQRELQYAAIDLLAASARHLDAAGALDTIESLARTKSWWDTVDGLAAVGASILRSNRALVPVVDRWIDDPDFWVARLAILHEKGWAGDTDVDRLFHLALRRGGDDEFFVRKAIGWALRDYAWFDPIVVRAFVNEHAASLSSLTRREALKNVNHPRAGERSGRTSAENGIQP
jgi:3-methyladenine DNA glycosylase AlkD